MGVWDHLPARNLISMQQIAALKTIEREMLADLAAGYPVDHKLDQWRELKHQIDGGPIA
jgi:hypothetical protein